MKIQFWYYYQLSCCKDLDNALLYWEPTLLSLHVRLA